MEYVPGVSVRYVSSLRELGAPDLLILPGTKNTMADLQWLRESGLEAAIKKHTAKGGAVLGICGGYQMLGQSLEDPDGVEQGGSIDGMGLLPMKTVFQPQKTRTQAEGEIFSQEGFFAPMSAAPFLGYEIHMGQTSFTAPVRPFLTVGQKQDGACMGKIAGTYVHGLFDREEVAKGLITALLKAKGLSYEEVQAVDIAAFQEQQYEELARQVRASLDMDAVYRILEQGV